MNSSAALGSVTTETARIRVLIVDDYADNRTLLRMILQRQGMQTFEAGNGQEAIEIAHRERPDLILMDLNMPIMDGFEATRQLKQFDLTKLIPILAVSAHCNDHKLHQQALEAGCIDCLAKPIDWKKFQAMLDTLLFSNPS